MQERVKRGQRSCTHLNDVVPLALRLTRATYHFEPNVIRDGWYAQGGTMVLQQYCRGRCPYPVRSIAEPGRELSSVRDTDPPHGRDRSATKFLVFRLHHPP